MTKTDDINKFVSGEKNKFGSDELKVLVEDLRKEREALDAKDKKLELREEELKDKLAKASKMTVDEAKNILLAEVQNDLQAEIAKKIRSAEEKIKLESAERAKEILADAMKHGATEYVAEYTVSTVLAPNDKIKYR